jgi:hypothetical protein
VDSPNNVRSEASRHFRNEKLEYQIGKINSLQLTVKTRKFRDLYKGMDRFKRDYQPRNNLVIEENGDLLAESHSILNRWKNYISCCSVYIRSVMLYR